jgi:DNA-binding CsgD family transcriptional regulator
MAQGKRDRLSTEQRIDMWRRWKSGESLHEIGRAFGKGHGSIRFLLTQRGGIVPAARRRSLRTLTLAEREDISRGIASDLSIREIAKGLQRAPESLSGALASLLAFPWSPPYSRRVRPEVRFLAVSSSRSLPSSADVITELFATSDPRFSTGSVSTNVGFGP